MLSGVVVAVVVNLAASLNIEAFGTSTGQLKAHAQTAAPSVVITRWRHNFCWFMVLYGESTHFHASPTFKLSLELCAHQFCGVLCRLGQFVR